MKTLFTNGCSWTAGGSLHQLYTNEQLLNEITWPNHLGKLLNVDRVINKSAGCGSNQRIFRTTFDWIISQPKDVLENTIAVIQWTEPSRYEYYIPKNNNYDEWVDDELGWAFVKTDVVMSWNEKDHFSSAELVNRENTRFMTYSDRKSTRLNSSH